MTLYDHGDEVLVRAPTSNSVRDIIALYTERTKDSGDSGLLAYLYELYSTNESR